MAGTKGFETERERHPLCRTRALCLLAYHLSRSFCSVLTHETGYFHYIVDERHPSFTGQCGLVMSISVGIADILFPECNYQF